MFAYLSPIWCLRAPFLIHEGLVVLQDPLTCGKATKHVFKGMCDPWYFGWKHGSENGGEQARRRPCGDPLARGEGPWAPRVTQQGA
jgi:hypothetical protein